MMNWILIISSLYLFKRLITNNSVYMSGMDERIEIYPFINKNDNITNEEILKIYEKKELLDFFESSNMKKDEKLYEINGRGVPSIYNAFKGGLLDDWNFVFDNNLFNLDGQ